MDNKEIKSIKITEEAHGALRAWGYFSGESYLALASAAIIKEWREFEAKMIGERKDGAGSE